MMSNYPYKVSSSSSAQSDGLGLLLGESLPGTIKVDHVFTIKIAEQWEKPIRKWVDKCLDLSKKYVESFHFVAAGIGSYFFLMGVAKIVEARGANRKEDEETKKPKNKAKKKDRTGATETTS